jgi:hypothetical protein
VLVFCEGIIFSHGWHHFIYMAATIHGSGGYLAIVTDPEWSIFIGPDAGEEKGFRCFRLFCFVISALSGLGLLPPRLSTLRHGRTLIAFG